MSQMFKCYVMVINNRLVQFLEGGMLVIKAQLHSTILNSYISISTFKGTVSLSNMNLNKHNHNKNKKQN